MACACGYKPCKATLRVFVFVGLMCLLVMGIIAEEYSDEHHGHHMRRSAAVLARRNVVVLSLNLQVVEGKKKKKNAEDKDLSQYYAGDATLAADKIVDINYMSKRRVPNGADPIHNRRAGKSRQPPSRA